VRVERDRILELVYSSIKVINQGDNKDDPLELKEETRLIGKESKLTSLTLVTLIVDIEGRIYNELGAEMTIVIPDEEDTPLQSSPILDIRSLTDYICSLLKE